MSKAIKVFVSRAGESKVETKGFAGATCRKVSGLIEVGLGANTGAQITAVFH